ncbi:MAG: VCBS repeat-containing protein [Deltaproteobacteria bacterium]|nr:VCBS repeat-containing protein [Deltaproteobacteria bacterium]
MNKYLGNNLLSLGLAIVVSLTISIAMRQSFMSLQDPKMSSLFKGERRTFQQTIVNDASQFASGHQPQLSRDGKRISFVASSSGNKSRVYVWQEGFGYSAISAELSSIMGTPELSGDGLSVIFLGRADGAPVDKFSLYLWSDGYGVTELLSSAFVGLWGYNLSQDGSRAVFIPLSGESRFLKNCGGVKCREGQVLLMDFVLPVSASVDGSIRDKERMTYSIRELSAVSGSEDFLGAAVNGTEASVLLSRSIVDKGGKEGGVELSVRKVVLGGIDISWDVDGDGARDLLLFQHTSADPLWHIHTVGGVYGAVRKATAYSDGYSSWRLGAGGSVPVAGDYNGDGILDFATYRPERLARWTLNEANWNIYLSADSDRMRALPGEGVSRGVALFWGEGDAKATPGDFDGDGATDVAVYSPSSGAWQIMFARGRFNQVKASLGLNGYGTQVLWGGGIPVVGDYNGDGQSDLGLWEEPAVSSNAKARWKIFYLADRGGKKRRPRVLEFGRFGDIPVPADYNGDSITDIAVFRPSNRTWFIRFSENNVRQFQWGIESPSFPVPADYDGDGLADFAFYIFDASPRWQFYSSSTPTKVAEIMPNTNAVVTSFGFGNPEAFPQQQWLWKHYRNEL